MQEKSISEIEKVYDLELKKIINHIKKQRAKNVLLQFPEGMKPYAQQICDYVEDNSDCKCFIWMGSCFGGCDVPFETEKMGIDLVIQFGHSEWKFN